MYWKNQEDLLEKFRDLEGQNLFLIQMTQEYQQELEESQHKLQDFKKQFEDKVNELKKNRANIQKQIEEENLRIQNLQNSDKFAQDKDVYEDFISGIECKIKEIYTSF